MKPEDKEVFNALVFAGYKNIHLNNLEKLIAEEFFKAALAHRDAQPAVAQEPVRLEKLFAELLKGTYSGKESHYNDEQISDACYTKAFEIALVAQRKGIQLYTAPPAAAINEQLLKALKHIIKWGEFMNQEEYDKAKAAIAAAEIEKAKGGV